MPAVGAVGTQPGQGTMPNYYQSGPSGKGKDWYKKWLKQFGGRGRYGGGKEAFDLALAFAKGGGQSAQIPANATNPIMTAAYNAGKDYMRATGQRESSSGGNAQAGLLATLAAGKAGGIAQDARNSWMNQLTGLGDLEGRRLGIEIGEEGGYGDYFLQRGNSRTDAWLRNKALNQQQPQGVTAGASYMNNTDPFGSKAEQMAANMAPVDNFNHGWGGGQPQGEPGSWGSAPTSIGSSGGAPTGTGGKAGNPAPNPTVQNAATNGIDPFAAYKASLKQLRTTYPGNPMGRVR